MLQKKAFFFFFLWVGMTGERNGILAAFGVIPEHSTYEQFYNE